MKQLNVGHSCVVMVLLSEVEIVLGLTGIDLYDVYKKFPDSWKGI